MEEIDVLKINDDDEESDVWKPMQKSTNPGSCERPPSKITLYLICISSSLESHFSVKMNKIGLIDITLK